MAALVTIQGPSIGQRYPLLRECIEIGRQGDSDIYLESLAVSRQHARLVRQDTAWFVEDAGSSNGTYLNGEAISGRVPFGERDSLQIGPYVFALRADPPVTLGDSSQVIRARVE